MNPERSVCSAHDPCLAYPVLRPLERVGERLALVALRIGENLGDAALADVGIVEMQDNLGPEDATALSANDALGGGAVDAGPGGNVLGMSPDVGIPRPRGVRLERGGGSRQHFIEARAFRNRQ